MADISLLAQPCGCHVPYVLCPVGQQLQAIEAEANIEAERACREGTLEQRDMAMLRLIQARQAYDRHVGLVNKQITMIELALEHLACYHDPWHEIVREELKRLYRAIGEALPPALYER